MKNIIKKGSSKLGGLLFHHPKVKYFTLDEWCEQGFPDEVYIIGTPDQLIIANIPIVDARFIDGVFYRIGLGKPKPCKWKIPHYLVHLKKSKSTVAEPEIRHYDFITPRDPNQSLKKGRFDNKGS